MTALFITGTDTGVGKTVVSALLMAYAKERGSARYHKPIQTGVGSDCDASTIRSLLDLTKADADYGLAFKRPLSPHLAASYEGVKIDFLSVLQKARASMIADLCIIEGAGGVLVPINEQYLMLHLIQALAIPSVIVARSTLGTINHTLLTIEVLRTHKIPIQGVVMVGEPNSDNERSIASYGKVSHIFSIPLMPIIDKTGIETQAALKKDQLGRLFA